MLHALRRYLSTAIQRPRSPIQSFQQSSRTFLIAPLVLVASVAHCQLAVAEESPSPAVDLNPQDVVKLQLEAMGNNDANGPDSGIAVAFRFASPANKVQTGPIEKFKTIVRNPAYVAMIDNTGLKFGETVVENETALVPVEVTDSLGKPFGYLFRLSRQSLSNCDGCWMTDSVAPLPQRKPGDKSADEKGQLL